MGIIQRLHCWFKLEGNIVHVNLEQVAPLLTYWMESLRMEEPELQQEIEQLGLEHVLLSCRDWLLTSILHLAKEQRTQGQSAFLEELMRFALRADVPFFDLLDFRHWVCRDRMSGD